MSHDTEQREATGTSNGAADDPEWSRLSPRLLLVNLSMLAGPLALFAVTVALTGANLQALISLGSLVITFLVIAGISTMRLLTTRFRVTGDRVELRSGLLFRSRRSVPFDRIRSVDIAARPMHRLFGLTSLRIGTGALTSSPSRKLSLDGIRRANCAGSSSTGVAAAAPPARTRTSPSPRWTGPGCGTRRSPCGASAVSSPASVPPTASCTR
ncbi:PH domain-containing protein [Streptomyces sp. PTD9-10]|uniref:PH domain-containing protein n=1 Tax=Streptomyces sp. PTD9-10 TaxID=3120151 RepID=UPI003007FFAE